MRLVSDGLWTIPPEGESATTYLTDSIERPADDTNGSERSIRIATNMSDSARYHAMANTDQPNRLGCISRPRTSRSRPRP